MIDFDNLWILWNCEKRTFPKNYKGVMLAASGHTDSTALFHLFCQFSKGKKNFLQGLIHVNYKLRGQDSEDDQKLICDLAKSHDLSFHCLEVDSVTQQPKSGKSFQEWARTVRYDYFSEFTKKGYVIALAHHADDLAENIVYRLCRGAEPEHLAGMQRLNGYFWRPVLHLHHADLIHYLHDHRIPFNEDSSNRDNKYTRNFIRNKVLPDLELVHPGARGKLLRLNSQLQDMSKFIQQQLRRDFDDLGCLPVRRLRTLPFAVFKQLVSLAITELYQQQVDFTSDHLEIYFRELVAGQKLRSSFNLSPEFALHYREPYIEIRQKNASTRVTNPKLQRCMTMTGHLAPGDSSEFATPGKGVWRITNQSPEMLDFQISIAGSGASISPAGCAGNWQAKVLKQRNRDLFAKAGILYIIRAGNSDYLFNGYEFVCPDRNGLLKKVNVSAISIDLLSDAELV